jgi:hypothetical protein
MPSHPLTALARHLRFRRPDPRSALRRLVSPAACLCVACASCWFAAPAVAQNDWQYPDPYFGILEFEKSHDATTRRRYRSEVSPAPRREAGAATDRGTEAVAAPRSHRLRWRTKPRR